jgi:hypothetical protein
MIFLLCYSNKVVSATIFRRDTQRKRYKVWGKAA